MKQASAPLAAHLDGEVTTLATCWKVTRTDGIVQGFTDHDRDLVVDGLTCRAASGFRRTAIRSSAGVAVDNLDIEAVLDSEAITDADLRAGRYDRAEIEILMVNWADPSQGVLRLRRGWLGEVTIRDHMAVAELRGLMQALTRQAVELYTPECRADLGDARCKVDLEPHTRKARIVAVQDRRSFTIEPLEGEAPLEAEEGWYDGGVLTWLSGANLGLRMEIRALDAATGALTLFLPMAFAVAAEDELSFHPGCDKRLLTCIQKFDNVLEVRGEPFVPGHDELYRYPDAQ